MRLIDFDETLPWYLDPELGLRQTTRGDDGGYINPQYGNGEDAQVLSLLAENDPQIAQYLRQQFGFDPRGISEDFRYTGGGENREVFNSQSGQWERSVLTQAGRMPESMAKSQGLQYNYEPGLKTESGGFFPQLFDSAKAFMQEGPGPILLAPFTGGVSSYLGELLGSPLAGSLATSGISSALTGEDPLRGMLTAGLSGAAQGLLPTTDFSTDTFTAPESVGAYTQTGDNMSGFYNDLVGLDDFGVGADDAFLGDYFRSVGADPSVLGLDLSGVDNDDAYTGEYLRSLGGDPPVGTGPDKSVYGAAGGLAALAKFAQSLLGSNDPNKLTLGQSILKQLTGDPLSTAFSAAPFLLSLNEANKQGKDIDGSIDQFQSMIPRYQAFGNQARGEFDALNNEIGSAGDLTAGRYGDLLGEVTGNESAFLNAQINPLRQAQATGYGNLLQDQGLRGIRGSSFGDQSITNFMTDTNRSIADQTAKALQSSYGLRSGLVGSADDAAMRAFGLRGANTGASLNAGMNSLQGESGVLRNVLDAQTKRNTNRNMLLGAGLSASGRLFQPERDPFNLKTLFGGL